MVIFRTHPLPVHIPQSPGTLNPGSQLPRTNRKVTELGLDRAWVACLGGSLRERGAAGYATLSLLLSFPRLWTWDCFHSCVGRMGRGILAASSNSPVHHGHQVCPADPLPPGRKHWSAWAIRFLLPGSQPQASPVASHLHCDFTILNSARPVSSHNSASSPWCLVGQIPVGTRESQCPATSPLLDSCCAL